MKYPFIFFLVDALLAIGYVVAALMHFIRQVFSRRKSR